MPADKPGKKKKQISMLTQVAVLFIGGVMAIGLLSLYTLYAFSMRYVRNELKKDAEHIAMDLGSHIEKYPASEWMLNYWYENYPEMDIEYDADYSADTRTAQKYRLLMERHPDFLPEYASTEDVEALPEEDQKLYAEIAYSWLITGIDRMQKSYNTDYLFGVVTQEPYDKRIVLFIAKGEDDVRGDEPGQIYPIGRELKVSDSQRKAILNTVSGTPSDAPNRAGDYVDYYSLLMSSEGRDYLICVTRNVKGFQRAVRALTKEYSRLMILFLTALSALCVFWLLHLIVRPLDQIQQSIRAYTRTKDSNEVIRRLSEVHSRNELNRLCTDVADMAREIDSYTDEITKITAERGKIEAELALANRIQMTVLPRVFPAYPDRTDFDIYASMTPAKEVGGDFYDFFLVDKTHLCMVMADVSGKGIPAALFMMSSKISLSNISKQGRSPARVFTEFNDEVCANNPEEMFITAWVGILDLETGILTAANAGHEYPMFMQAGSKYILYPDHHDPVLGAMEGLKYHEYEIKMKPGARIFVYTDGLAETVDPQGSMFGTKRILEQLNRTRELPPELVLEEMKQAIHLYVQSAEPFDDLTMLCVEYRGPGRAGEHVVNPAENR